MMQMNNRTPIKKFSTWINEAEASMDATEKFNQIFIKALNENGIPENLREPFNGWYFDDFNFKMLGNSFKFSKSFYNEKKLDVYVGFFWEDDDDMVLQYETDVGSSEFGIIIDIKLMSPTVKNLSEKLEGLYGQDYINKVISMIISALRMSVIEIASQWTKANEDIEIIIEMLESIRITGEELDKYFEDNEIVAKLKRRSKGKSAFGM